MERNTFFNLLIMTLCLLPLSCTTDNFDVLSDGDEILEGESSGTVTTPTISGVSSEVLEYTIEFDDTDETLYGSTTETVDTTDEDFVENADFTSTVTVSYNGSAATVSNNAGVTVSTSGAHVTITSSLENVEYVLTGSTSDGSFKIYSSYKFKLTLDDVSITNPSGAAINIQSSKRAFVVCNSGTENTLVDGSSYTETDGEDMKACIFSEGQLIFSGSGSLSITGNYKHGICSDEYVRFRSGCAVTVVSAVTDGIHTNESVLMGGGIVKIESTDDGVQCEEGTITVSGGFMSIVTTGDKGHALNAASDMTISGGAIQAQTSGAAAKGISCDGNLVVSAGKVTAITSGDTYYDSSTASLSSCAGIKVDGNMTMSGGTLALSSSGGGGKGINCDGSLSVTGGVIKVITTGTRVTKGSDSSSAKGIRVDGAISLNADTILVKALGGTNSEGIEGKSTITINGGLIAALCYDDCINSAKALLINDGYIYCYSSANDGIDSNTTLTIKDGVVIGVTATSSAEEGLDSESTMSFSGGVIIGVGSSIMDYPSSSSSQRSIVYGSSGTSGDYLRIATSSGTDVLTYQIPRTYSTMVLVFSSPTLSTGTTYTITKGGTVSGGTEFFGYYTDATYSGGTQATSFTITSTVTTVGSVTVGGTTGGGTTGGGTTTVPNNKDRR